MRFERKFQQIANRDAEIERWCSGQNEIPDALRDRLRRVWEKIAEIERWEREEAERRRLESRTLWEKIADLKIDDDLRDVLWALAEGRED